MLSELSAVLEFVTALLDNRKVGQAEKNRDRVMVAIYKIGQNGTSSVTPKELQDAGFTKLQIYDAIEAGTAKGWIMDCSTFGCVSWALTLKGVSYVEALLEDKKGHE